jgi:hypothetical protein
MSTLTARRGLLTLAVASALLVGSFAVASSASASTLYACVKKSGSAHVFAKKPKCKKGETKISWNSTGTAGKNGTNGANGSNGTNGTNGKEGAAGQPQKAIAFKASQPGEFLTKNEVTLFTMSGVTVNLDCVNFIVDGADLEATAPAGSRAQSGMISSKANNTEATGSFQQNSYDLALSPTEPKLFGALVSNSSEPFANVGHITAEIETGSAIVVIQTFIESGGTNPKGCTVDGVAFSIPA